MFEDQAEDEYIEKARSTLEPFCCEDQEKAPECVKIEKSTKRPGWTYELPF